MTTHRLSRDAVDVGMLAEALHQADCRAMGLAMHESGSVAGHCGWLAPLVAREYAALSRSSPAPAYDPMANDKARDFVTIDGGRHGDIEVEWVD